MTMTNEMIQHKMIDEYGVPLPCADCGKKATDEVLRWYPDANDVLCESCMSVRVTNLRSARIQKDLCPECGNSMANHQGGPCPQEPIESYTLPTDEDAYEEPAEEEPKFFCVAIGLEDRAYGGPEEGGWWYDTFEPVDEYAHMTKIVKTADEAYKARDELRTWIEKEKLNEGRRPISSVLSTGQYDVMVFRGRYPHSAPERRPHYE